MIHGANSFQMVLTMLWPLSLTETQEAGSRQGLVLTAIESFVSSCLDVQCQPARVRDVQYGCSIEPSSLCAGLDLCRSPRVMSFRARAGVFVLQVGLSATRKAFPTTLRRHSLWARWCVKRGKLMSLQALRLLVPNTPIQDLLKLHARKFENQTGIPVVLTPVNFYEMGQEVSLVCGTWIATVLCVGVGLAGGAAARSVRYCLYKAVLGQSPSNHTGRQTTAFSLGPPVPRACFRTAGRRRGYQRAGRLQRWLGHGSKRYRCKTPLLPMLVAVV